MGKRLRLPAVYLRRTSALTAVFLLFVLVVSWLFFSGFFSSTPPLHFVSTCSMFPALAPGDTLILSPGVPQVRAAFKVHSPFSYPQNVTVRWGNFSAEIPGSLYSFCSQMAASDAEMCNQFLRTPEAFSEQAGPIVFNYTHCAFGNGTRPCVGMVSVFGAVVPSAGASDVILFDALLPGTSQKSTAVHRSVFSITDSLDRTFYFTKGDNNPVFDTQLYDYAFSQRYALPVESSAVRGKVAYLLGGLSAFSRNSSARVNCSA